MTLDTAHSKEIYQGNGAATVFPFAFKVWSAAQVLVTRSMANQVGETDVTAQSTIALTENGGTVTYLYEGAPLPSGATLAITRNMPFTQGVDLISGSQFDPQVIEDALDQATAERQQVKEMLGRAVILPSTSDDTPQDVVQGVYAALDRAENAAANVQQWLNEVGTEVGSHSYVTATDTTTARTLADRFADVINVQDFGAVGDGVTDDTAAIQAALAAVKLGGSVCFEPNKTYLTSPVVSYNAGVIDLAGSTLVRPAPFSTDSLLSVQPVTKDIYTDLSTAVVANQNYFTLPSDNSVKTGDLLAFKSNDESTPDYTHGQYSVVTHVVENTVYMSTPFYADYTVDSLTVYEGKPSFTLKNGKLDISNADSGLSRTGALNLRATNVNISGITFVGSKYTSILANIFGENITATNCHFNTCMNIDGSLAGGRTGYGFNAIGNNITVSNCIFNDCKHAFTSGGRDIMAINLNLKNVAIYENADKFDASEYKGAIDVHCNVLGICTIDAVRVIAQGTWLNPRSPHVVWNITNSFFASKKDGSRAISGVESNISRIHFHNCRLSLPENSLMFVPVATETSAEINNVIFDTCTFMGGGIYAGNKKLTNFTLTNCTCNQDFVLNITNGWENILIQNNIITSNYAFTLTNPIDAVSKHLTISGNRLMRADKTSSPPIRILGISDVAGGTLSDVSIENNSIVFLVGDTSTNSCISFRDVEINRLRVANNTIYRGSDLYDSITLRNTSVYQGTILGNNVSSHITIYANPTATKLTNFSVVGNTGTTYRVATNGGGSITKARYKFDTDSNNFVTVEDAT